MGESSQNENEMYIEEHVERIGSENVQTKNSRVEKNGEQLMKKYCKNYTFKFFFGKGITIFF
jgi:glycine/serine hydroxymethyltransferase